MFSRKRFQRSTVLRLVLTALLLGVGLVAVPQGSAGAATCSGTGCYKRDPQAYGCNTGTVTKTTITARSYYSGALIRTITASLRASNACGKVAWMKVNALGGDGPDPYFHVESANNTEILYQRKSFDNCDVGDDFVCDHRSEAQWSGMIPFNGLKFRICGADTSANSLNVVTRGPIGCSNWYYTAG